jgi:hypothetical protein
MMRKLNHNDDVLAENENPFKRTIFILVSIFILLNIFGYILVREVKDASFMSDIPSSFHDEKTYSLSCQKG